MRQAVFAVLALAAFGYAHAGAPGPQEEDIPKPGDYGAADTLPRHLPEDERGSQDRNPQGQKAQGQSRDDQDRYSDKYLTRPGETEPQRQVHREGIEGGRLPSSAVRGQGDCEPKKPRDCGPKAGQQSASAEGARAGDGRLPQMQESRAGSEEDLPANTTSSVGINEPLSEGVAKLTPRECEVRLQHGVDDERVSWEGKNREWIVVLREMLADAGLHMSYRTDPCVIAIATSKGVAQRMLQESFNENSPVYAEPMTYEEWLNGFVEVHMRGASLVEILEAVTPDGWTIYPEIEDDELLNARFDINSENTRGQVMQTLQEQMGVVVVPYTQSGVLVVSKR